MQSKKIADHDYDLLDPGDCSHVLQDIVRRRIFQLAGAIHGRSDVGHYPLYHLLFYEDWQ